MRRQRGKKNRRDDVKIYNVTKNFQASPSATLSSLLAGVYCLGKRKERKGEEEKTKVKEERDAIK